MIRKFLFLLGLSLFALPASATITRIQEVASGPQTSGFNIPITSTAAGNMLVLVTANNTGNAVATVTDGGDTFVSASCPNTVTATTSSQEIWYVLNNAGGRTVVTPTFTGGGSFRAAVAEYHSTVGTMIFEVCNALSNIASSSTPVGASVTTSGTNDVVIGVINNNQNNFNNTLINGGVTFNDVDNDNGNYVYADLMNQPAATYAPKYNCAGAVVSGASTAAFKEPAGGSAAGSVFKGPYKTVGPTKTN